jgi:hypothetical protein
LEEFLSVKEALDLFLVFHRRRATDIAIINKQAYSHRVDISINDKQTYFSFCL